VGTAIRLVLDLILVLIGGVTEQKAETCLHAEIHVVVDGPGRGAGHVVDGTIDLDAELLAEPQAKSEDASDAIFIVVGVLPVHVPDVTGADPDGAGIATQGYVEGQPAANRTVRY